MNQDEETHISTTRARAGSTPHVTRYVLGWGLGLVILLFFLIYLIWN
ncbi:hypothetical protein [Sphingosinicella sp.]